MTMNFDVVICGAGPVGLATAALLIKRGMHANRIALVDSKPVAQAIQDPRSIALSYGSRQILESIGVWQAMTPHVTAIHDIHVSRRNHFGRTLIDRDEHHVPALGYVTRYGALVKALSDTLDTSGINTLRPAKITGSDEHDDHVAIHLDNGQSLTTHIAIQAEGGVFGEQAARALQHDYQQIAVVAHVHTSATVKHRAFERFTSEGPLALLPQDNGYALVWCVRPAHAEHLLALSDTNFLEALGHAFGGRVGRFTATTPRHSFPLGLNAKATATARIIPIGNAAQTLHPVAGQGLNLGLRDAVVLSNLVAHNATPTALTQFHANQSADRSITIKVTDMMARLFASSAEGSMRQTLLGLSLGMIDTTPFARRLMAEQMMYGHRR